MKLSNRIAVKQVSHRQSKTGERALRICTARSTKNLCRSLTHQNTTQSHLILVLYRDNPYHCTTFDLSHYRSSANNYSNFIYMKSRHLLIEMCFLTENFLYPYCRSIQSRYAPLVTPSIQAVLSKYHSTVLRTPLSNVSAGIQPNSRSILLASIA